MKRSLLLTALSLAPVVAPPATAQGLLESAPAQVVKLYSRQVGDSFKIRVLLPPMTPGEATRFPVVYMTDTHSGFAVEDDMLRLMMLGDTPRFIAVGIGYPGASSILQAMAIRARDLTHVPMAEANVGAAMPVKGMVNPSVANGGAAKFLAFLRDELIPFIDARYPTDPEDRVYWGDSLGGLFGCYVLFTKPETFNRYVIGSPSIWWAGEDVLKLAEQYTKTHDDLTANVFLGVGGLEELPSGAGFRMVTNVARLETLLRAKRYPGLQLTTRVFPDETHTTVVAMNLIRGLVSVFGPQAPEDGLLAKLMAPPAKP